MIPTLQPVQGSVPQGITDFVSVARALDPKSKERAALLALLDEISAAGERNTQLLADIGAANDAIAFRNEAEKALSDARAEAARLAADAKSEADAKRREAADILAKARSDAERIGRTAQADRDTAAAAKREATADRTAAANARETAEAARDAAKADREAAGKDREESARLRADLDRRLALVKQAQA